MQRYSRQFLAAVLGTVGQGIITIDTDSRIVMVNPKIVEVWSYAPDELIGKDVTMLMPVKYRRLHKVGLRRYAKKRKGEAVGILLEVEGLKKDGTVFPLEIRIEETPVGDKLYMTAAVRDHTEHNQVVSRQREQIKELKRRIRQLEQSMVERGKE